MALTGTRELVHTIEESFERMLAFVGDGAATILAAYLPLVRRRFATPYGERERRWQLYRRGRHV